METVNEIEPPMIDGLAQPQTKEEILAAAAKHDALQSIKNAHAAALDELTGHVHHIERDTWPDQRTWAETHLSGNNKYDNELEGLKRENETVEDIAKKIMAKSTAYRLLIMMAGNIKREAEYAVETAKNEDEIKAALNEAAKKSDEAKAAYLKMIAK